MENKKCQYYVGIGECSKQNNCDDLGECIYNNGIPTTTATIHCYEGKKILGINENQ